MNHSKISLVNNGEVGVKFESKLKEPKIVELDPLGISLPWVVASLEAESSFDLLKAVELRERLLQQLVI